MATDNHGCGNVPLYASGVQGSRLVTHVRSWGRIRPSRDGALYRGVAVGMGWLLNRGGGRRRSSTPRKRKERSLTVIGGSEPPTAELWKELIEPMASSMVANGWTMNYCGMGTGLSGAIAKQVLARQGKVRAILMRRKGPPDVPQGAEEVVVPDFFARQKKLFSLPAAIVVLPGGMGTADELTSLIALRSAGLVKAPVVLVDPTGWFDELWAWYAKARTAGASSVEASSALVLVRDVAKIDERLRLAVSL